MAWLHSSSDDRNFGVFILISFENIPSHRERERERDRDRDTHTHIYTHTHKFRLLRAKPHLKPHPKATLNLGPLERSLFEMFPNILLGPLMQKAFVHLLGPTTLVVSTLRVVSLKQTCHFHLCRKCLFICLNPCWHGYFGAFCLDVRTFNFLPTHGFSVKPLKERLLAEEQKATLRGAPKRAHLRTHSGCQIPGVLGPSLGFALRGTGFSQRRQLQHRHLQLRAGEG